jgi:hypothetical protein
MPSAELDAIRATVAALRRAGAPPFTSIHYTSAIDPWWLETPARRGELWRRLARLAALDPDA